MMGRVLYFAAWFMLIFGLSACAHNVHTHTKPGKSKPPLPVEKHTQRPTHLPLTNTTAMHGEWDIFIINDDKFSEPYGTLRVRDYGLNVSMPCSIHHHSSQYIRNGKFVDERDYFKTRKLPELLGTVDKTCLDTPGVNYTKSLLDGTFYGDRKTIWFDGPYVSFIAKRSDRIIPNSWLNKNLAVVDCLLDHPKIGADKYWGSQIFINKPNRLPIFTLADDGIEYWNDCKPDYEVEVKTVKYSLTFLEAKSLEVKADISAYSSEVITGGRVERQTNSIDVIVNPDWARKNQEIIKRLTDKHPYIIWREGLIPDEVLASGKY